MIDQYSTVSDIPHEHPNGGAGVPVRAGPREHPRIEWLDFPEDCEYADFKIRAWVNHPKRLDNDLSSGDPERIRSAISQILLEHNGWIDQDGEPYPPASDPDFWDSLSNRLGFLAMTVVKAEGIEVPKSLDPMRKRR